MRLLVKAAAKNSLHLNSVFFHLQPSSNVFFGTENICLNLKVNFQRGGGSLTKTPTAVFELSRKKKMHVSQYKHYLGFILGFFVVLFWEVFFSSRRTFNLFRVRLFYFYFI